MELLYKIAIGGIIILSIAHFFYTFKKYKKISEDALWFLSAALGLMFSGLINYLNLTINNRLTFQVAIAANISLALFSIVLAVTVRTITTYTLLLFALLLVGSLILYNS